MIKKYLQFINKSNDYSLDILLESNIVYSNKLAKVLSKINSPIAKKLIEVENKDYPVTSNYFDITSDKNNSINFIPDRKAKEILGENIEIYRYNGDGGWLKHKSTNDNIFSKLGYKYEEDTEPYKPNYDEDGEMIGKVISDVSRNTYIWVKWYSAGEYKGEGVYNQNKLSISDKMSELLKNVWSKNRQDITVGRCVRAIMKKTGDTFTDKEYELFVNLFKSEIDKLNNKFSYFDVVEGNDIHYWYQYTNYYERKGTIGNSCMSHASESMLEIYTNNKDKIKLVILRSEFNEEKIKGRAILWYLDNGIILLDRIYTINDSDVQLFKDYAKENGWYSKLNNYSTNSGEAVSPSGETENLSLVVTLNKNSYDEYPYLDTLKYLYNGKLSNKENSGSIRLEDTDGGFITECDICGGRGRVDCPECGGNGHIPCSECDENCKIECSECDGKGKIECTECYGNGEVDCPECDGSGLYNDEDCKVCNGRGKIECTECDGDGEVDCRKCDGDGEVDCPECDGEGNINCYECGGDGEVDCPECS